MTAVIQSLVKLNVDYLGGYITAEEYTSAAYRLLAEYFETR